MTDLSQKFNALESSLAGRLDSLVAAQSAQVAGLQALAAALQAIGACLCEDIAASIPGGEPPPVNEPPTDLCGAYERAERVQSWQLQGEATVSGVPCKLWAPLMSYSAGFQGWRPHTANEAGRRAHIINQNWNPIFWCFTWDFTGTTAPVKIYRDISSNNYAAMQVTTSGYDIPSGNQIRGSDAYDRPAPWLGPGNPDAYLYIQYVVAYPADAGQPSNNVWFKYPVQG